MATLRERLRMALDSVEALEREYDPEDSPDSPGTAGPEEGSV